MIAIFVALGFLIISNAAPIIAERVLRGRFSSPIDCGINFFDGRVLFGHSKTVRGVVSASALCAVFAIVVREPISVGVLFALYAMLGDLLSSFLKRRIGIAPSGKAVGLDQIPESLLPLWLLKAELELNSVEVVGLVIAFFLFEIWISRWLFRWNIRNRPY